MGKINNFLLHFTSYYSGVPDGAARLKTRSAGWNRAGWEPVGGGGGGLSYERGGDARRPA